MGISANHQGFDADGSGYDMDTANEVGDSIYNQETKHYGSIDPRTGMILKGKNHPTWNLMVEEENRLGNKIIKKGNRYYSVRGGQ